MSMTNEQIDGRLNAIRKAADPRNEAIGGYSYISGAPTEACFDVQFLLAHIDGLNLRIADLQARSCDSK